MPKRAVFEGSARYQELNLANSGKDTARYDISLIHYRMKEDGSLEELKENDSSHLFADQFVRFYPRSVVLAPNESQVVRIQLTQINKLQNGEYRSHLYFRAVPKSSAQSKQASDSSSSSTLSIQLKPVFGISVPVIIRVGQPKIALGMSHCSFEKNPIPMVKMTLSRTGNFSAYGDITVDYISPSGTETRVGLLKGVAIYTPNSSRSLKLPINNTLGIDYTKGKLHIVYMPTENINSLNIAQAEVYLN